LSIVDAHTHVFQPAAIANRDAYRARDRWFDLLYANPGAQLASPEDILASMAASGIERSVLCGFPWADPDICREQTDYLAEVCRGRPDRFSFLATVVPHLPGAEEEVAHAKALGAAGIGELNADAQGFDLRDGDSLAEFVHACRDAELPIMLHSSEPVGHDYPGKGTATPDKLVAFLASCPDQPVVLAHWGGGLPFYELMPEVRAVTSNVFYDSAATTYLYAYPVFSTVVNLVGAERVLFASDYPILTQGRLARRVERLMTEDEVRERVFWRNAVDLFGLAEKDTR